VAAAAALAVYLPLLAAACVLVWRRPVRALYAFIVGLALHNLVMVLLYDAGVRGASLTVIQAWKEILLATALARVSVDAVRARALPFRPGAVDLLAAGFALVVLVYAVLPQELLGGEADRESIAYGARHALLPVGAYAVGRALPLGADELRRLATAVIATALSVAAFGIVELYAVPLDWWRSSGAAGWFGEQLGHDYEGLSGLPENFVYNAGDERPLRRLVSTFLSPLATAYVLCVALLLVAARPSRLALASSPLLLVALALTHTRAAFLALAGALCVLAVIRRTAWPVAAAAAVIVLGLASVSAYEHITPRTTFTAEELRVQRERASQDPDAEHGPFDPNEPSLSSHLRNLRDGLETVARHPQGYGLGNAGATAERFDERPLAGESNYTEIGVETGIAGLALFVAWAVALFLVLARAGRADAYAAWLAASVALVLALALQTDAIGIHWVAYVLWALAGGAAVPSPLALAGRHRLWPVEPA
jgi:O-Antigen ligase